MCRGFSLAQTHCFSLLSEPWQPFQWPVFTARGDFPHGKQYFRITATFGILPRACNLKCTDCNPAMDSFRVRDSHPIPLFSEQACVSDCSGRAFATKAMVFSCLQDLSLTDALRSFYISAHKKTSPALLSRRQKKSRVLCIFGLIARKNDRLISLLACLLAQELCHFCNFQIVLRTCLISSYFQNPLSFYTKSSHL